MSVVKPEVRSTVELADRAIAHIGEHGFDPLQYGEHTNGGAACFIGTLNIVQGAVHVNDLTARTGRFTRPLLRELDLIACDRLGDRRDDLHVTGALTETYAFVVRTDAAAVEMLAEAKHRIVHREAEARVAA